MEKETWQVFAKLKHKDGAIEPKRLWLAEIETLAEAHQYAVRAVEDNKGVVLAAWVEPAPQTETEGTK